jgi:hypothetical protein
MRSQPKSLRALTLFSSSIKPGGTQHHAAARLRHIAVVSRIFRTFNLAERHPALAHAVMAPLICWSWSSPMLRYLFVDHAEPAMWRSLAARG